MRKVYRLGRRKFARDLSGTGSWIFGGRWNSKGTQVLYTAVSPSLAMLEWLAHTNEPDSDDVYCLTTLRLPPVEIASMEEKDLPENWRSFPFAENLQQIGNRFLMEQKYLGIAFPSVIMPMEHNILLNPDHPEFVNVEIISVEQLVLDERLFKKPLSQ